MKNYIRIILCSLLLIWATPSNAEFNFGVGLIVGQVESDGTETEGTAADTSDRTKSFEEAFVGADIFAEYVYNGYTLGVTYIPIEKDVGRGTRTDVSGDGNEKLSVKFNHNLEISFNSRYLIDIASQLDGDKIEIFFNDTGSPALIKDPSDFDSIYVVMPMKG